MEMTANVELTKEKNLMELLDLLRKNNMQEAANNIFEMAAYVDVMEKKMDSVLEELVTVKDQLHKMEEREAEKGLKQTVKRAVNKLEQDCKAMKEKLFEVKTEIKAKAGEIVTAAKQKGKAALNKVAEFLGIKKKLEGIRQNVQESIADVDKSIGKIDAFGRGMREAGQKIANTFRTFADKPEKEYGEKKFSKTELIKKPFQAKRKLLSGILNCADAAIAKTEQLAADVKKYQTDKAEREMGSVDSMEAVNPVVLAMVAEPEFQYGAEAFEAHERGNKEKAADTLAKEASKSAVTKSR
jgi:plasmid segregation protein ParM